MGSGLAALVTDMSLLADIPANPEAESRHEVGPDYRTPKSHSCSSLLPPTQCHQLGTKKGTYHIQTTAFGKLATAASLLIRAV